MARAMSAKIVAGRHPRRRPLTLKFASLAHHYFRPEGVSDDICARPWGRRRSSTRSSWPSATRPCRTAWRRRRPSISAASAKNWPTSIVNWPRWKPLRPCAASSQSEDRRSCTSEREKIQPSWLTWKKADEQGEAGPLPVDELAAAGPARGPGQLQQRAADARAAAVGARAGPLSDDEPFPRVDDAARPAAVGLADGPHRPLRVVRDTDRLERQQRERAGPAGGPRRAQGPIHARRSRREAAGPERRCPGRRSLRHRPERSDAAGHLSREGRAERRRGQG